MTPSEESKIRREGFPINCDDTQHLLDYINFVDSEHKYIEAEIVVKLELLSQKFNMLSGERE